MTKQNSEKSSVTKKALPVRRALQKYVKKYVTNKEGRLALAKFLSVEETSVNNMLYGATAPGSLDRWVSAIHFCQKINTAKAGSFFEDFEKFMRKSEPFSKLDKLYFDLSNTFDEEYLIFLFDLIKTSAKLNIKKKKPRRNKKA